MANKNMATDKSLKAKNTPLVITFIAWCLAVYIAFLSFPDGFLEKIHSVFDQLKVKDGLLIMLSPILSLILTGFISSENKARLVFFRIKHALPGHRAFTELIKKDSRIDMQALARKLGSLPKKPKEQNTVWYALYKKSTDSVIVQDAHKNYLLSRDLCTTSLLFAIVGPLGIYYRTHNLKWCVLYSGLMALHYLVLAIVAQTYGNRFVCNVLAEYIHKN